MSGNHTKAGRRASFRAFCDPEREAKQWRAQSLARQRRSERDARQGLVRSFFRVGAMVLAGAVADRVVGAR